MTLSPIDGEGAAVAAVEVRPRCACCRRPFDAHLIDEDRPQDTWRICPYSPSKRERYSPDNEHASVVAAQAAQAALLEALERVLSDEDVALSRPDYEFARAILARTAGQQP